MRVFESFCEFLRVFASFCDNFCFKKMLSCIRTGKRTRKDHDFEELAG